MRLRGQEARRRASASDGLRWLAAFPVLLAAILLLAGCGGAQDASSPPTSSSPTGDTDIEPAQLATMLEHKDFVLINTHIPYAGEIEKTDLFLPYDQSAELVDQLPADKSVKIVVYCRSDRMSRIAAEEWAQAGYTNLYSLHWRLRSLGGRRVPASPAQSRVAEARTGPLRRRSRSTPAAPYS